MLTLSKRQQATRKIEELAKLEQFNSLLFRFSLILLLICVSYWAWTLLHDSRFLPIRKVHIVGNFTHLDQRQLRQVIGPFVNKGFFNIDLAALKNNLQNNIPWIAQVDVNRVWPDGVAIHIVEHKPIAIWNNTNLLSSEGIVFTPRFISSTQHWPHFFGAPGQQVLILNTYHEMALMLANLGLQITDVELSPRLAWTLCLNNGMKLILGRENVFARIQRLIKIYPRILVNKTQQVDYVDLRYPNGVAVKWHNDQTEQPAELARRDL